MSSSPVDLISFLIFDEFSVKSGTKSDLVPTSTSTILALKRRRRLVEEGKERRGKGESIKGDEKKEEEITYVEQERTCRATSRRQCITRARVLEGYNNYIQFVINNKWRRGKE